VAIENLIKPFTKFSDRKYLWISKGKLQEEATVSYPRASTEKFPGEGSGKQNTRLKIAPLSLLYFISIMYENLGVGYGSPSPLSADAHGLTISYYSQTLLQLD